MFSSILASILGLGSVLEAVLGAVLAAVLATILATVLAAGFLVILAAARAFGLIAGFFLVAVFLAIRVAFGLTGTALDLAASSGSKLSCARAVCTLKSAQAVPASAIHQRILFRRCNPIDLVCLGSRRPRLNRRLSPRNRPNWLRKGTPKCRSRNTRP